MNKSKCCCKSDNVCKKYYCTANQHRPEFFIELQSFLQSFPCMGMFSSGV